MAVRWDEDAKSDLQNILDFYTTLADESVTRRVVAAIRREVQQLSITPLLQKRRQEGENFQTWLVYRSEYRVYYKRIGPRTIYVYRIWPCRRVPLKSDEII